MNRVGYFNPFVPPEWVAAHGLRPAWLTLNVRPGNTADAARRGMCPCIAALIAEISTEATPDALVLTTICDQMRYASAYLDTRANTPIFLLNIPSTWQPPESRELYRDELQRLGRFLLQTGGCQPTSRQLEVTIEQYDQQRRIALGTRAQFSARRWAEMLVQLRSEMTTDNVVENAVEPVDGIPLALIGGPLLAEGDSFLALVEESGGRIVVDATETGERTLPGPVNRRRLQIDPLDELVRIYFDTIPDAFRRPNTRLYDWLKTQLSAHSVRGVILRRYPFCDLWHAELHRLRHETGVPVLDIDVAVGEEGQRSRNQARLEAFLEMLR